MGGGILAIEGGRSSTYEEDVEKTQEVEPLWHNRGGKYKKGDEMAGGSFWDLTVSKVLKKKHLFKLRQQKSWCLRENGA